MLLTLLGACATVPDADHAIATAADTAKSPIEGARGPLTIEESRALIAKLTIQGDGTEVLQRHLAIEEAVAGRPLTADNEVHVLRDGAETFEAITRIIRDASHDLDLEYYTIEDVTMPDGTGGTTTLLNLLLAKRREGVEVNILYDSYGSSDTPGAFFDELAEAGANLLEYHPIAPTSPVNVLTLNNRNHRKILVADGAVAVVGGVNLSKSYESKSPGSGNGEAEEEGEVAPARPGNPPANPSKTGLRKPGEAPQGDAPFPAENLPDVWHDTAIRIAGPAAAELQALFRQHWATENGPSLRPPLPSPSPVAAGNQVVRIIGSTPDDEIPRYYVTLISALRNAEQRAWVSAAYFVPTPEEKEALIAAAERGVDVRLMLAGSSDSEQAVAAARTHYTDFLDAGIKIYEVKNVVLHSKTVTIDGVWSAIGSSNFDHRSVLYNDEVDAIVLGAEAAAELESIFADGTKSATQIDPETWEDTRSFADRVEGFFVRMIENLL
ncbi:MAG TPA: phospholipase D-like domain-containing protein [Dongiaceae bacterium]|nr:phospholipase D-like domain-containing protein [Dongiaceae bacterium]